MQLSLGRAGLIQRQVLHGFAAGMCLGPCFPSTCPRLCLPSRACLHTFQHDFSPAAPHALTPASPPAFHTLQAAAAAPSVSGGPHDGQAQPTTSQVAASQGTRLSQRLRNQEARRKKEAHQQAGLPGMPEAEEDGREGGDDNRGLGGAATAAAGGPNAAVAEGRAEGGSSGGANGSAARHSLQQVRCGHMRKGRVSSAQADYLVTNAATVLPVSWRVLLTAHACPRLPSLRPLSITHRPVLGSTTAPWRRHLGCVYWFDRPSCALSRTFSLSSHSLLSHNARMYHVTGGLVATQQRRRLYSQPLWHRLSGEWLRCQRTGQRGGCQRQGLTGTVPKPHHSRGPVGQAQISFHTALYACCRRLQHPRPAPQPAETTASQSAQSQPPVHVWQLLLTDRCVDVKGC